MSKFNAWWKRFVRRTESVDCAPRTEEMINGRAFSYRLYPLERPVFLNPTDTLTATVTDEHGEQQFSENAALACEIDTVAMFRFKDALGMVEGIGGAFGKRKL
jgi:hypothetical protein